MAVQLTYRYSSEYIQATLPNYATSEQYKHGLQVGGAAVGQSLISWSIVGAYYF